MNADHQRRVAQVAEAGAVDVAARIAGSGARHGDVVAVAAEKRARLERDREHDRSLPGRAAAVLDLELLRAGPDRLQLPADRGNRPMARIEAHERGWRDREHGHEVCLWTSSLLWTRPLGTRLSGLSAATTRGG